ELDLLREDANLFKLIGPVLVKLRLRSPICCASSSVTEPETEKPTPVYTPTLPNQDLKGFLVATIITSAAGFMSAFAPNYTTLTISRCLVGLGLGGTWMFIFSAFWTFGAIFEAALAWIIMPGLGWRWLLGASSMPSFFLLVFYTFTPESPRYLCLKGKKIDASKVLEKIAELNGNELPPGVLVSDSEIELQSRCPPAEDAPPVSTDKDAAAASHPHPPPPAADSAPPKWKDSDMGAVNSLLLLVSPKLIRSTLLL
ncbi:hypothetical protein Tsubulata_008014, partial [Turnera subulata]